LFLLALTGCPGATTTPTLTPVTGILVRADALVSGIGCGTRDDQIYRYAAVITQHDAATNTEITQQEIGGVFDCFADAAFRQLLPGTDGKLSFNVQIYAFNFASYTTQNTNGQLDTDAPKGDATDWNKLQNYDPTYSTSCTATQQENVEVLAVCDPLTKGRRKASLSIDTSAFPAATAGVTLACDVAYATVQGTFSTGTTTGDLPSVKCPAPIVVAHADAPATYDVKLRLLDAASRQIATVQCRATTAPRAQIVAICDPADL